jgi:transcriptional antiterminator RfaH
MTPDRKQHTLGEQAEDIPAAGAVPDCVSSETPVAVTAGSALEWYVIYSKRQRETWAELHLRRKGIEAFHPVLGLPHYAAGRRRSMALFPNYVFVRIELATQFCDVIWSPGVKSFVGAGGVPLSVDDSVVHFLKRNATADGQLRARPDLKAGQEVEIVDGPFAGLMAIIQNPPDANGRIRMLMRLLNRRHVAVQVPARYVQSIWVA